MLLKSEVILFSSLIRLLIKMGKKWPFHFKIHADLATLGQLWG